MTNELEQKWIDSWMKLANYLSNEKMDGKTIFTLSFQDGCNFIVYPEGKDGKTLDLTLCFDIPLTEGELWKEAKQRADAINSNACNRNSF